VAEARKKALNQLAEFLFDSFLMRRRRSAGPTAVCKAIVRGTTGPLDSKQTERTKIMLHLGQAHRCPDEDQEATAADELEKGLGAGFAHPRFTLTSAAALERRTSGERPAPFAECRQER